MGIFHIKVCCISISPVTFGIFTKNELESSFFANVTFHSHLEGSVDLSGIVCCMLGHVVYFFKIMSNVTLHAMYRTK